MRIINCEQGSPEWINARLGLVSASRFKDVMTEPRAKKDKEAGMLSGTAESYMQELISEILTGQQMAISGKALDHGTEYEPAACTHYEFMFDIDVEHVGIILTDDRKTGASPDGLVGADGMIEIKCPYSSKNHIATIISGCMPSEHMPQVQGNMWINGRQWCDFISFDPRIDGDAGFFVQRIYRDEEYIQTLEEKVSAFVRKMEQVLMQKFGIVWDGVNVEQC